MSTVAVHNIPSSFTFLPAPLFPQLILSHSHPPNPSPPHTYFDEVIVTLSPFVGDTGEVGVSLLTVTANHPAVVELVLPQESLRVIVTINVDLGQGVVCGRLFHTFMYPCLQPGE